MATLVLVLAGHAETALPAPPAAAGNLFTTHEPLALELTFDRRALCLPRPRKPCTATPAVLGYRAPTGLSRRLDIHVQARGKWRNKHCDVPPLFLDLGSAATENGPFAGHPVLPLTTHCRTGSARYEQYLLKEYLAYRLYGLFTDKSLRVRLARITYRDSGRRGGVAERFGFFVEHFETLAARHDARVYAARPLAADGNSADGYAADGHTVDGRTVEGHTADRPALYRSDAAELATLAVFQYLIGNTDWSAVTGHNVVHIRNRRGLLTAVPFDFDFSGLVNARYASPPPSLPLRTVRQRLFRGFCDPAPDWDRLLANFAIRRGDIEALTQQVPALESTERASVRKYIEEFFEILASPEQRHDEIVGACRSL